TDIPVLLNTDDRRLRTVFHFPQRQLPTRRHHISSTRIPCKRRHAFLQQYPVKLRHALFRRLFIRQRPRIPRNQIHFHASQSAHQPRHSPRILRRIVHSTQQHIFKRNVLPRSCREFLASRQQLFQRIFLVNRHQHIALLI